MEQNQDQSLFDMNMDSSTQSHLLSISKWTKFISIVGFVICGLVLLLLAVFGAKLLNSSPYYSRLEIVSWPGH